MKRWVFRISFFLLAGMAANVGVAWLLAAAMDMGLGQQRSAAQYDDSGQWSVVRLDRFGAMRIRSTRIAGLDWSPQQAAGMPDTNVLADQRTAWASSGQDSGDEWLDLQYATAVRPREVHVYETCAPGALFKVSLFDEAGIEHVAWTGVDPVDPKTTSVGIAKIPVSVGFKTQRVKIYLDSAKVPGWNEIDAVGLIDERGQTHWARKVTASSTYASRTVAGLPATAAADLVPWWCVLQQPGEAMRSGLTNREERFFDARGWPMLSMAAQRDLIQTSGQAGGQAVLLEIDAVGGMPAPLTTPASSSGESAPAVLPLIPIWPGFLVNTVFYGAVLAGMWCAMVAPLRFFKRAGS